MIVVCSSSKFLFESICEAGGQCLVDSYNQTLSQNPNQSLIAVGNRGELAAKEVYFISWKADANEKILQDSIRKYVSEAIKTAAQDHHQSIAFPAIGCGKIGCSIDLIAEVLIDEVDRQLLKYDISVIFVIEPMRTDIYDRFQQQIFALPSFKDEIEAISIPVMKGRITIEQGDLTRQQVIVLSNIFASNLIVCR